MAVSVRGEEDKGGGLHGERIGSPRCRTGAAVLDAQELARLRPGIGEEGPVFGLPTMRVLDTAGNASGMASPRVLSVVHFAPSCAIGCLTTMPTQPNKNHPKTQNLVM